MERVGIYVRISSDVAGEGLGVQRQEDDCRALAQRNGWPVVDVYVDNDVSAYSGRRPRPAYLRMLQDVQTGRIDGVLCWHPDRLHRSPKELEAFIDIIEATSCEVHSVQSGKVELSSSSGRLNARIVGGFARYESEIKSERIRRKMQQNAEAGKHHGGSRPFGWQKDRVTLDPVEAEAVRMAARLLLAGNSIKAVVRALNDSGSANSTGRPWRDVTVRSMLLRPRNAGLRQHHGEVIGAGLWQPILDRDTWDQVRLLLTDPGRRTNPGSTGRTHLLSGIAICGVCNGPIRVAKGKPYKGMSETIYRCHTGSCVSRSQARVDERVRDVVVPLLGSPLIADAFAPDEDPAAALARARADKLRTDLALLDEAYRNEELTVRAYGAQSKVLEAQLEKAERAVPAPALRLRLLDGLAEAPDVPAWWESRDVSVQRQIVAALLTVTILPVSRGPGFKPESVRVERRQRGAGVLPPGALVVPGAG